MGQTGDLFECFLSGEALILFEKIQQGSITAGYGLEIVYCWIHESPCLEYYFVTFFFHDVLS